MSAASPLATWATITLQKARPDTEGTWISACCPLHEDARASFRLNTETGGWTCRAGCGEGNVWELAERLDLPTPPNRPGFERTRLEAETVYTYQTAEGQPFARVTRTPDKRFWQSRWEGGAWVKKAPAASLPYRLPDLHQADPSAIVFWVEGEKDADRAAGLGLLATTSAGGASAAGKLSQDALEVLRGRQVVILPDHDDPGRKYAATIAARLQKAGALVRTLELAAHWPGGTAPKGGDLSDWLEAGGTRARLLELIASGPDPSDGWDDPIPFDAWDPPAFPLEVFPKWLADFVAALATATQTAPDLTAMLVLSALGVAVQGKVDLEARPGWREPLCLYTVTALDSGNRKSAVFREVTRPIYADMMETLERVRPQIDRARLEREALEQQLAAAKRSNGNSNGKKRGGTP